MSREYFAIINLMKKIALRGIDGIGKYVLVDDENFEWLDQLKWVLNTPFGYVCTSDKKLSRKMMHHFLIKRVPGMVIDHINRNKLDNRKENLRICSQSENCLNRHKKKNVLKVTPKKGHGYQLATFPFSHE